jgi:tetratricopeptide (TPR) repeat protein
MVELNNAGVKAMNADDLEVAIEKFEQALKLNPAYVLAKENLSIAYNNKGLKSQNKPIEALEQFHKALYVKPDNTVAHQNLDGMVAYIGKNPKNIKDRVGLAEDALRKNDQIGGYIEYKQALAIQEDPVVRAKFDEVARVLDPNYKPVPMVVSTDSIDQARDKPRAGSDNPMRLFSPVVGWLILMVAVATVFALGFLIGGMRKDKATDSKQVHHPDQ